MSRLNKASVYVHWPYCAKRCTYCNFNKYISEHVDHERMKRCLVKEAAYLIGLSGVKTITSIFFGGGTPSLAKPETIRDVCDQVAVNSNLPNDAEITMEVNPTISQIKRLSNFKAAGINRFSIGIQTFDPANLKVLGRDHTIQESLSCIETAKKLLPGKVSIDMIFGLPDQTFHQWKEDLHRALDICDNHMSLYQLTLERGTRLFKMVQSGELKMPDADLVADMYEYAVQHLEKFGYHRYEVSNFSRTGYESRHNQSYWRGMDYIGIGPGAHGRFTPNNKDIIQREARIQTLEPEPWMWEVEHKGHATRKAAPQTKQEILEEIFATGMRTSEGVYFKDLEHYNMGDISLGQTFRNSDIVDSLLEAGFIELNNDRIAASYKGLNVLDSILPYVLKILNDADPAITRNSV